MSGSTTNITVSIDPETAGIYDRARVLLALSEAVELQCDGQLRLIQDEAGAAVSSEKDLSMLGYVIVAVAPVVLSKFIDLVSGLASKHKGMGFVIHVPTQEGESEFEVAGDREVLASELRIRLGQDE
ncbi:hypothetical protein ACTPOK_10105 [Streptomyces inhibens]|uniref:hypothetical protein n=1 Tax=Streptomyces inhibens TaxID=2293571 RepID=UPI00402ABC3D